VTAGVRIAVPDNQAAGVSLNNLVITAASIGGTHGMCARTSGEQVGGSLVSNDVLCGQRNTRPLCAPHGTSLAQRLWSPRSEARRTFVPRLQVRQHAGPGGQLGERARPQDRAADHKPLVLKLPFLSSGSGTLCPSACKSGRDGNVSGVGLMRQLAVRRPHSRLHAPVVAG
jgi:hypothetical protein